MTPPPRRWHLLHRWLCLGFGAWFVMVGASGSLLVWRDELDAWLNPQWFRATAPGPPLALETVIDRVRREPGLGSIERIRLPREPGQSLRLIVRAGRGRVAVGRFEAFIDPATGDLIGIRGLEALSLERAHVLRTVYELHRNLLAGEPGSEVVGIAGLLLLIAIVSGGVLAWPRTRQRLRRLLAVSWRANTARLALDLHRGIGTTIVGALLLSTLTGATLVYLRPVRSLVSLVSPVLPMPVLPMPVLVGDDAGLDLDLLRSRVESTYPAHRVAEISLPARSSGAVMVKLAGSGDLARGGDTIVWIDPASGAALAERSGRTRSGGEAFMHWLLPLHVGSAFGAAGLVLMTAAGAAPMLLLGTGGWLWWVKRRHRRGRQRQPRGDRRLARRPPRLRDRRHDRIGERRRGSPDDPPRPATRLTRRRRLPFPGTAAGFSPGRQRRRRGSRSPRKAACRRLMGSG